MAEFKKNLDRVEDKPRPGRPITGRTPSRIEQVKALIDQNPSTGYANIEAQTLPSYLQNHSWSSSSKKTGAPSCIVQPKSLKASITKIVSGIDKKEWSKTNEQMRLWISSQGYYFEHLLK